MEIDSQLLENLMIEFVHLAMMENNERVFTKRIQETSSDFLLQMLYALNSISRDILDELTDRKVQDGPGTIT